MASFIRLLVCSSRHLLSRGRSCSAVGLETGRPGPRSAPRLPAAPLRSAESAAAAAVRPEHPAAWHGARPVR